jgi:hypothetical protein
MVNLPTKESLAGVGATYGQVRSALGDLRDFLAESIGTSGSSPVIDGSLLSNVTSIGVGIGSPGATVQIVGSLAITDDSTSSINPGDGNALFDGKVSFPFSLGTKLEFLAQTGNALAIGRQTDTLYLRTKLDGFLKVYEGGVHQDTLIPGIGGRELLSLSDTSFTYKGQVIYHSGNGVFLRKDQADSAPFKITFNSGLRAVADVEIGEIGSTNRVLNFLANTGGNRINLNSASSEQSYVLGLQPSTLFFRSPGAFTFYRGGAFINTAQTPGVGGTQLMHIGDTSFTYKNFNIYHSGNANFLTATSAARPGVTRVYNEPNDTGDYFVGQPNQLGDGRMWLVSNIGECRVGFANVSNTSNFATYKTGTSFPLVSEVSSARPGVHRMWIGNQDSSIYTEMHWNGSRMQFIAASTTGQSYETIVDRANFCNRSDAIHGHNIDDGTVRFYELSIAQGSIGGTGTNGVWGVHSFAFASPVTSNASAGYDVRIGYGGGSGSYRFWRGVGSVGGSTSVVWDYVTGSGDPYIWVLTDNLGNIESTYDAEDPFDRSEPETCPFIEYEGEANLIRLPSIESLLPMVDRVNESNSSPLWGKGVDMKTSFIEELKIYAKSRNLMKDFYENPDMDLREFVLDLPGDNQKKQWRTQAIIRALTKLLGNQNIIETQLFLQKFYKVSNGKLELK